MRRCVILLSVICYLLSFACSDRAFAFAPNSYSSKIPDLLAAVIKNRVTDTAARASTGSAISTVLGAAATSVAVGAAVGTPVGWAAVLGSVLFEAGVSGAVGIAAGGIYDWLFNSDGKVQSPATPAPATGHFNIGDFWCATAEACVYGMYAQPGYAGETLSSVTCYWSYIGGEPMSISPPASLCGDGSGCTGNSVIPWNCSVKGTYANGNSFTSRMSGNWFATGTALNGQLVARTDNYSYGTFGSSDVPSDVPAGDTLDGYLPGPEVDLGTAETEIPDAVASEALDPNVLANALNQAWQKAASQPGYAGEPYDASNPVTGDEISEVASKNGGMPTVGDFISPVVDGDSGLVQSGASGGAFTGSIALPVGAATDAGTGTGTGSNTGTGTGSGSSTSPASIVTCGLPGTPACEVDWGGTGGAPADPTAPTMASVLSPIFNLFPGLKSWVAPSHSSSCPAPSFTFYGQEISFSPVCSLLGQYTGTIGNASVIGATFLTVLIVLGA